MTDGRNTSRSSDRLSTPGREADRSDRPLPGHRAFTAEGACARKILLHRRRRDATLAIGYFGEPAWDIFLDLFANEVDGIRVPKSGLMIAASVPSSTALRWICGLVEDGYLFLYPDEMDGRRVFVGLSKSTFEEMAKLLASFIQDNR